MTPTPLRPPSLEEAGDALAPAAPRPLAWPTVFDTPSTVDRVWTDFVAAQGEDERLALRSALAFARARHRGQRRRGSETPYWVHLVRVALELARWEVAGPTLLQAALLHDTLEDTPTTAAELEAGFGPDVAALVGWLTTPDHPTPAELRAYYTGLAERAPVDARLLKIADRVDNLRSIQALVMRTGSQHRRWAGAYLARTGWQVMPLAAGAPSVARVDLIAAMADLAPLVEGFTEP
jgi:(p)ppGpp synthase/HD superfamily hydrolase